MSYEDDQDEIVDSAREILALQRENAELREQRDDLAHRQCIECTRFDSCEAICRECLESVRSLASEAANRGAENHELRERVRKLEESWSAEQ